jgi:hypothetical protein
VNTEAQNASAAGRALDETRQIEDLAAEAGSQMQCRAVCEVRVGATAYPVYVLTLGNADPASAAAGFFGGIHGLERIGSQVVLIGLRGIVRRLRWDTTLHRMLENLRLVFMPVVNPGGLARGTRANPQGVDLMRNAPLECTERVPFLLGGQRISAGLPWYRGAADAPMQAEAQALCEVVRGELLTHDFSLALDCHSGFGLADRLWFPHAHTRRPIEHLPEFLALSDLLDDTLAHHRYLFEPQSRHYLTHGDLWDYLYLQAGPSSRRAMLPLTLEMGSWLWVRKNPRQVFSRHGLFNPLIEHREHRVLRRHLALFDFVMRAVLSHADWRPKGVAREACRQQALERWYGQGRRP